MIDDAFKERDPVRHAAMRGISGKVSFHLSTLMILFCASPYPKSEIENSYLEVAYNIIADVYINILLS